MTHDQDPTEDWDTSEHAETEIEALRRRCEEAEATLAAIRLGEVDAVVVEGARGQKVYSLESSDQPYRVFIERMEEGAITIADNGVICYANSFFAQLVGIPHERVMGLPFEEFVESTDLEAYRALLAAGLHRPARAAMHLARADGAPVRTAIAFSPLPTRNPRMAAVVVTDLTTQDRFERVDAARATAEASNMAKDHFLALLGHELRTPLNAIVGWTQLLREKRDDPALVTQALETIIRNASAQSRLIDELLDVSRISSGKLRLERAPLDFADVVKSAYDSIAPSAEAKQIRITLPQGLASAKIHGDAARLEQVVWNVLSNAVKFTPKGGRVDIGLVADAASITLTVADDGHGIDPKFLPFVFDVFRQGNALSTTRTHGGLGLGLTITREIVELHRGMVRVESAGVGKGATFTVTVPRLVADEPVRDATRFPPIGGRADFRGLKFLVVDNDRDALECMRRLLVDHGANVAVAASTDEALELVESFGPQVLLSDIAMPNRDGYDLIRTLRARGRSAQSLPAIAITAFAGAEERRRLLAAGFQRHLAKPLDLGEVVALLERFTQSGDDAVLAEQT